MDTINDHIVEAHGMIGVSDKNFLKWIEYSQDVKVSYHAKGCEWFDNVLKWLKEQYFDEFVEDMNDAYMDRKTREAYK